MGKGVLVRALAIVVVAQVRVRGIEIREKERPSVKPMWSLGLRRHKNALVKVSLMV